MGTSPAYGCSAQVIEATVDMETGEVTLDHVTAAHDCGFAINKTQVEGQIQGNVLMGIGEARYEEVKVDDLGRIVNANLAEYKIPTMLDIPTIEPVVVESNEPNGPYGAKEVGEGGIMPTIPAVMNAVYNACGAHFTELPLSPERVLSAIKAKKEGAEVASKIEAWCERVMEIVCSRGKENG